MILTLGSTLILFKKGLTEKIGLSDLCGEFHML